MKKIITWLLVMILVAGSIWAAFYFRNRSQISDAPEILRTTKIDYGDLTQTVSASGNLRFEQSVNLSFSSTGTVTSVDVDNGESVIKGKILAAIDASDYEQTVLQAEIALEQAELNLRIAQEPPDGATVKLAENAVNSAGQALEAANLGKQSSQSDASSIIVQAEREREAAYINLREASDGKKPDAQTTFDTAVEQEGIAHLNADLLIKQAESQWWSAFTRYKQTERTLEQLLSPPDAETIKQLELQVNQARLNLEQAEQAVEDASIVTPFDGVVTQINIQIGVEPKSLLPAIKLVDKSNLYIDIAIDEIDIGKVTVGMPTTIKVDAYPETSLPGLVDAIAPSATNVGGIVSYNVSILITESNDVVLREGMTSNVDIIINKIENVLLIPNWAIRTDQETSETYCYRIETGIPYQTAITLGTIGDSYSSVTSGMEEGNIVGLVTEERNLLDPDFRPDPSMRR